MRARYFLLLLTAAVPFRGLACSCFGPSTFCATLNAPTNPEWWMPDAIVLGVKMASVAHGMDVLVLQGYLGGPQTDDVVRVWGDTGLLCRMYADSWDVGDTVVWALRFTDQLGGAMEQPGDHVISVCGVYWLDYAHGMVSGPIFTEGQNEHVPISEFGALVDGCLSTGVEEEEASEISVRCTGDRLFISTSGAWSGEKEVRIIDPAGRMLHEARFCDAQATLPLRRRSHGLLLVRVADGQRSVTRRVLVE